MEIVVNTRLLRKNDMDGIGWFTYHTIKEIVQNNPDIKFHFLFDTHQVADFIFGSNVQPHILFPPAKHAFLNVAYFQWSVTRLLNKIQPALFLSPDGNLSLGYNGKQYGVMHDISFFHFPGDLKKTNAWYYNYYFPKFAKKATRLGTVSTYSKQDIAANFGVEENNIDVVYCGINDGIKPASEIETQTVQEKYSSGLPYFLFVGTLHPRKNIVRLLQAFAQFKSTTSHPHKLVIVGKTIYGGEEIQHTVEQSAYKTDIIFTGRLDDDTVSKLYAAAFALVFVPHFEGFGIPILEAMKSGTPVITSNTTSMPEVAGDASLLVNPLVVDDIAAAMSALADNELLRQDLISKGIVRANEFSWKKTANLLWDGVNKIL